MSVLAAVFVRDEGAGVPVLCLHGIGSSHASFDSQFATLTGTRRVIAWDAPGYGLSDDPPDGFGTKDYLGVLTGIVEEIGGPVHVIGASWGGVLGMLLALDHPGLVRSLVLVGSSRGAGRDSVIAGRMRERLAEFQLTGASAYAERRAASLLGPGASPRLLATVTDNMAQSLRLPGYAAAIGMMTGTDLTDRLGLVRTPTLVLVGDDDTVTGPSESHALADGIPDAVYVSVAHAGHAANQQAPDAVNAWTESFFQIIEHLYPDGIEPSGD